MSETQLTPEELGRLRDVFSQVRFARLLGLELVAAERGAATVTLEAREDLTRVGGILHGGVIVSLLDTAAAFAVHTLLEPGSMSVTVDLTVHFLRPVSAGRIKSHARVLRAGRRILVISVEATDPAGVLIATATTTYVRQA